MSIKTKPNNIEKVIVYAKSTCSYCKIIKDKFKEKNIDFKVRFTNEFQEEWNQVISLTDMAMLPTIHYKDNYFVPGRDFGNPDHLIGILENFNKSKFNYDRLTLEKIKTLNYNIGVAFSKLDKLLTQIEENTNEHKSTD